MVGSKKLVVDIEDDLKGKFKIYCTENHTNIHEQIIGFIERLCAGSEQPIRSTDQEQTVTRDTTRAIGFNMERFRNRFNLSTEEESETDISLQGISHPEPEDIGL
jgi:hypothetical protein